MPSFESEPTDRELAELSEYNRWLVHDAIEERACRLKSRLAGLMYRHCAIGEQWLYYRLPSPIDNPRIVGRMVLLAMNVGYPAGGSDLMSQISIRLLSSDVYKMDEGYEFAVRSVLVDRHNNGFLATGPVAVDTAYDGAVARPAVPYFVVLGRGLLSVSRDLWSDDSVMYINGQPREGVVNHVYPFGVPGEPDGNGYALDVAEDIYRSVVGRPPTDYSD